MTGKIALEGRFSVTVTQTEPLGLAQATTCAILAVGLTLLIEAGNTAKAVVEAALTRKACVAAALLADAPLG